MKVPFKLLYKNKPHILIPTFVHNIHFTFKVLVYKNIFRIYFHVQCYFDAVLPFIMKYKRRYSAFLSFDRHHLLGVGVRQLQITFFHTTCIWQSLNAIYCGPHLYSCLLSSATRWNKHPGVMY